MDNPEAAPITVGQTAPPSPQIQEGPEFAEVDERAITTTPSLAECRAIIDDHGLEEPRVMFMPTAAEKVCVIAVFKDGRSGVILDIPEVDLHDNMAEVWRIHAMGPHGPHE